MQGASGNTVSRTARAVLRPVIEANIMARRAGPCHPEPSLTKPLKGRFRVVPRFSQDSKASCQFVAETDLRTSHGVNPQNMIRSSWDGWCQIQLSDCQASPWWQCRPKVRLGSQLTSWDPGQEGQWPWTSTIVAQLETGSPVVSLRQGKKAKLKQGSWAHGQGCRWSLQVSRSGSVKAVSALWYTGNST